MPARQCTDLAGAYLVVRSTLPSGRIAGALRAALAPVAPVLAHNDSRTRQQIVDRSTSPRRFTVLLLGASARDVQAAILGQTLRLAAAGLVLGAGASWLLARGMSGLLFGVTARDPRTFLAMAAVLALVSLAAGYLPARRASRIDTMVALRAE